MRSAELSVKKIAGLILTIALFAAFSASTAPAGEEDQQARIKKLEEKIARIEQKLAEDEKKMTGRIRIFLGKDQSNFIFGDDYAKGLHIQSRDGKFDISFGGRVHIDGALFHADSKLRAAVPDIDSGWEIRHPRVWMKGRIYGDFLYKLQYTLSDKTIGDAFVGITNLPVIDTVIVGKAARAFGNDPGPSSNYTLFMEYANTIVFGAGKQLGIAAGSPLLDERMSWAVQGFQYSDPESGFHTENNYNLNARITTLPCYEDKGQCMAHLGLSYSYRSKKSDFSYSARPEVHLAPNFVDTGPIDMKYANVFAYEAALVKGPFSLEGEYYQSFIEQESLGSIFLQGFYVQSSYFLTGESRGTQYVTAYGEFDSPVYPLKPFSIEKGTWGSWQVAARYSYLDLNDKNIRGGILGDLTVGLNWVFNPHTCWMFNYVHSNLNGSGEADIIATRFAINF